MSIEFLGQTEVTDNVLPCLKLQDLIRDDKKGVRRSLWFKNEQVKFQKNET